MLYENKYIDLKLDYKLASQNCNIQLQIVCVHTYIKLSVLNL